VNNTIMGNAGPAVTAYPSIAVDLEWANNTVSGNGADAQPGSLGFVSPKPVASFTAHGTARVNQPLTFANQSHAPGGSIAHALWDFGDGPPSNASNPVHTYVKPGIYRVTLVVWDTAGRGARSEAQIGVRGGRSMHR
jgi:PKD repeat protein